MRKVIVSSVLLTLLLVTLIPYGCTNKKPEPVDTLQSDSMIADTSANDSAESVIAETPMPKAADELFDDFVFNFAANRKLQKKRVVFPLPVYRNGKLEKKIDKDEWKMEHFFMRQEYYTLIFDNHRQKEVVKDTTIDHVVVEKIFFKMKTVQQFLFNRINGEWMMTSINYKPLYQNQNASFLKFYERFAVDSAFQVQSMADEVEFTAPDPEDDFSTISGVIVPQQWSDFKPGLIPSGVIYNILYGQKYTESNRKIFIIRGIANGLEMEMDFKLIGGRWKLVKFNS
ncbi:MAG: DUF4348 domain-containing protein [Prevotella sp.]|nr:DUF4348 domain-containing protein [Prevotella sp.]